MPLSCELGWHSADPLARWNSGYYFSKCTRCGCDLVRTAYTGWKVPKGFKVVWQVDPPEGWRTAALMPAEEEAATPSDVKAVEPEGVETEFEELPSEDEPEPELPIMTLLRDLERNPPEEEHSEPQASEEEPEVQAAEEEQPVVEAPEEVAADEPAAAPQEEAPQAPEQAEEEPAVALQEDVPEAPEVSPADEPAVAPEEEAVEETVAAEPAPGTEELPEPDPPTEELPEPDPAPQELPEPEPAPVIPPRRVSVFDDFMEEDPAPEPPWDSLAPRAPAPAPAAVEQAEVAASPEPEETSPERVEASPMADEGGAEADTEEVAVDEAPAFRPLPPLEDEDRPNPPEAAKKFRQGWWLAAAGIAAAAVLLARPSYGDGAGKAPTPLETKVAAALEPAREAPKAPPATAPRPAPAPKPQPQPKRELAFVAGSIVHCRAAPAAEAESVRKLARGAEVEILARDSDWLSVSHDERQCWVAARYTSPDKPL